MENLICGSVSGVIAFVSFLQSKKMKAIDQINKSTVLMVISVLTGVVAVLNLVLVIAG
jgi:hypothetical protein